MVSFTFLGEFVNTVYGNIKVHRLYKFTSKNLWFHQMFQSELLIFSFTPPDFLSDIMIISMLILLFEFSVYPTIKLDYKIE